MKKLKTYWLTTISALIIATLNALRGSNFSEGKWYDIAFSKWAVVAYFYFVAMLTVGYIDAIYFIAPIAASFAIGTGGLMQAYTTGIINNSEFKPLDWIANKLTGRVITLSDARKWGVWFGSLVGILFYIPFIVTGKYLLGLPVIGLGLYCGAMRYFNTTHKWRIIEFGYYLLYSILYLWG